MIGTHPTKMLNARLKQPSIRAELSDEIPPHFVCSRNVIARQKYFAMPENAANIKKERECVLELEATSFDKLKDHALPDLVDGRLKQLLVPRHQWRSHDDYLAITPVPSGAVMHEFWHRLAERKLPYRKWLVQPNPAARSNHGDPLGLQSGAVRMMKRGLAHVEGKSKWRGNYVCLRARVEGMNIASGMVAVGWPAITGLGGMLHALERDTDLDLDFAFGMTDCQWQNSKRTAAPRKSGAQVQVSPGFTSDEITAVAHVVLLARCTDGGNHGGLAERLRNLTRLCGGSVFDAVVTTYQDEHAPEAAYLIDASADMRSSSVNGDALDRALGMYGLHGEWRMGKWWQPRNGYTLIASGYGLLEDPQQRDLARGGYPHAWSESLYSLVTQGALTENSWWRRQVHEWGTVWVGV